MRTYNKLLLRFLVSLALCTLLPSLALADCLITGVSVAELNMENPELGAWKYTITMTWDTGTVYALSHTDILLDYSGNCTCEELVAVLNWQDPIGTSNGLPDDCTVEYEGIFECNGDPSIPDLEMPLLKFEPYEDGTCEPGPTGTGTFYIFSDLPPAPIAEENLFLVDKYGQLACSGLLTGEFPGLPCDPTPTAEGSWGGVKSSYLR